MGFALGKAAAVSSVIIRRSGGKHNGWSMGPGGRGGGWAQPIRPAGPEARPDMLGRSPSAAPPGEAGQSKNDRLPEKGTGKAEESLVVQRQHP